MLIFVNNHKIWFCTRPHPCGFGFAGHSPSNNNRFTQGFVRKDMKKDSPHSFTDASVPRKKGSVGPVQERRESATLHERLGNPRHRVAGFLKFFGESFERTNVLEILKNI